ncbi:hypothetical protein [Comamonas odontotermitis]|uniref:hypothetical protein n=1 Tax=Comamonas odontotermitis TaxID=379895 RepID=UPI0037533C4C
MPSSMHAVSLDTTWLKAWRRNLELSPGFEYTRFPGGISQLAVQSAFFFIQRRGLLHSTPIHPIGEGMDFSDSGHPPEEGANLRNKSTQKKNP